MRYSDRNGFARLLFAVCTAQVFAVGSIVADQPAAVATDEKTTAQIGDPFVRPGVMPTPIVPYASQLSEAAAEPSPPPPPASRYTPLGTPADALPPSAAVPSASPTTIDAGRLVPVTTPEPVKTKPAAKSSAVNAETKPAKKQEAKTKKEKSGTAEQPAGEKKPFAGEKQKPAFDERDETADETAHMTPIRTVKPTVAGTRPDDERKTAAETKPTTSVKRTAGPTKTKNSSAAANEERLVPQPPVRFSFPQPVIPLESSLRRLLGLPASRR